MRSRSVLGHGLLALSFGTTRSDTINQYVFSDLYAKNCNFRITMVDLLKDELKKVLMLRMNPAVDSVCLDFQEKVAQGSDTADFNRYYACCQHLIEYISQTMDTSPAFVEQMNRVVLASRNSATKGMLETVVKQDVWFQRREADVTKKQTTTKNALNLTPTPQLWQKSKHFSNKSYSNDQRAAYSRADPCESDSDSSEERSLQNEFDEQQCTDVYADENQEDERTAPPKMKKHQEAKPIPVSEFCLLKPQSSGQLETITQSIQNIHKLVDAQVCEPPEGYLCSRGCAKAREEMSTKSELRRVLQSVGAHLEECKSSACELKTRVEIRNTVNLVELKQLDICEIRCKLRDIKVNGSTEARFNEEDQQLCEYEIETLEDDLQANKEELIVLENRRTTLFTMMDSIRLDWRDEVVDSAQALHYVRET